MNSSIQSEEIPNSPNELLIKNHLENHQFSLEEIERMIEKLNYTDKDNLIYHLIQFMIKFNLFLLKESENNDEINPLQISSDLTKLNIIKDLYKSI